jgi:hypothetical protein
MRRSVVSTLKAERLETCALRLATACRGRGGASRAENGFVAVLDERAIFVCDACAGIVKEHLLARRSHADHVEPGPAFGEARALRLDRRDQ